LPRLSEISLWINLLVLALNLSDVDLLCSIQWLLDLGCCYRVTNV
jgi:hypothetical protein